MNTFHAQHGLDLKSKVVSGYDETPKNIFRLYPIDNVGHLTLFVLKSILKGIFKAVYDLELKAKLLVQKYIQTLAILIMGAI